MFFLFFFFHDFPFAVISLFSLLSLFFNIPLIIFLSFFFSPFFNFDLFFLSVLRYISPVPSPFFPLWTFHFHFLLNSFFFVEFSVLPAKSFSLNISLHPYTSLLPETFLFTLLLTLRSDLRFSFTLCSSLRFSP